jgi:DNA polymerase III epsilon subunit-like protein
MKEIGNARRYKILAEGETFITIQDVEDKDKRVLKVPISQVEVKNKSFGEDFTLFAEVAFPPWCEAVGLSVFDERSKRIVVIVDIDGTVADCAHRVHLAQATEWDEFHALSPYDTPKFETVEFIKVLQAQGYIIFGLTGRDEKYEQMTSSWLVKYRIPLDYTFMRPSGNYIVIGNALSAIFPIEFFGHIIDDDGSSIRELEFFCNPGIEISEEITSITGIKKSDVVDAPPFSHYAESVRGLLQDADAIVAHNLAYDWKMLDLELSRCGAGADLGWPKIRICTVKESLFYKGYRLNLNALHEFLFGCRFSGSHRARTDVGALTRCYIEMRKRGDL